jgi:hypothetical protein
MKQASIAVALAFALAPAAHAQLTCDDVRRLNGAVLGDFESLAGDEVDDGIFETSLHMAGAKYCAIDIFFEAVHSCSWDFSTEQAAVAAYNANVATLASCISGWSQHGAEPDTTLSDDVRNVAETHFSGAGEHDGVEWQLAVEQLTGASFSGYRLWVELLYF